MNPRQALRNLDGAVAQMQVTREIHAMLQQSVQVLAALIEEVEKQAVPPAAPGPEKVE